MLVETARDKICIKQIIDKKQEDVNVEGDIIVNDVKPDILNIISINGTPYVYKKEIIDGKVRMDGSINTYIIYSTNDENNIRSLNTVLDFTYITDMDKCKTGMILDESVVIKDFEYKILNERKINIKAILGFESTIYLKNNIDIITDIKNNEDIQMLNENNTINSMVGDGNTKVYVKETISINEADDLAEIMKADVKIVNKEMKSSYNKILAKADARINILYLTEDNRINEVTANIPMMGFINMENIRDDNICDATYKLKNLIIKPNNAELHSIYVEAEIEINCLAYETKNVNIIEDVYSIFSDLNFTNMEVVSMSNKNHIKEECNVNKIINIPEITDNQIYNTTVNINILNAKIKSNKIMYECEIETQILFKTSIGMDIKKVKTPFDFEINSSMMNENCKVETDIEISNEDFSIMSDGNIEVNLDLIFKVNICSYKKLNIIDEILMEECRQSDIYSMVIYFVKPADTLWKIAKKFKSTIQDITEVNKIEDINKIYIGQQLYIPKHTKKDMAV